MENEFDLMMMGGNNNSLDRHKSLSPGMSRLMQPNSNTFPRTKSTIGAPTTFEDIITNNRKTFYQPSSVSPINLPLSTPSAPTQEDLRQKQEIIDTHEQIVKFTHLLAEIQPKNQHLESQVNDLSTKKQAIMQQMDTLNATLSRERDDFDSKSNNYNQLVPELEQAQATIQELHTQLAPIREEHQILTVNIESFKTDSAHYKFHINKATEMVKLLKEKLEQKQAEDAKIAEEARLAEEARFAEESKQQESVDRDLESEINAGFDNIINAGLSLSPEAQGDEHSGQAREINQQKDDSNPFEEEPAQAPSPSSDPFAKIISKKTVQPPRPARPPRNNMPASQPQTPTQPTTIPDFANFEASFPDPADVAPDASTEFETNFPSTTPAQESNLEEKTPVRRPHQIDIIKDVDGLNKAFENFKPENDFIQIKILNNFNSTGQSPFHPNSLQVFNVEFVPHFEDVFNSTTFIEDPQEIQNTPLKGASSLFLGDNNDPFLSKAPNFESNHEEGWTESAPSNLDLDQVFGTKRVSVAGSIKFEDVFGDAFSAPLDAPEIEKVEGAESENQTAHEVNNAEVAVNPDDSITLPDSPADGEEPSEPLETVKEISSNPQSPSYEYPPLPPSPILHEHNTNQEKPTETQEIKSEEEPNSLAKEEENSGKAPPPVEMDRTVSSTAREINLEDDIVELEPVDVKDELATQSEIITKK
jgi:predicted  nucleic acid-binding Zn-ribbon protein